jgi:hypothetical protein
MTDGAAFCAFLDLTVGVAFHVWRQQFVAHMLIGFIASLIVLSTTLGAHSQYVVHEYAVRSLRSPVRVLSNRTVTNCIRYTSGTDDQVYIHS